MAGKLENYARKLLARTMREYSEYHWCAGWLQDLEYELWAFACGDAGAMWKGSFADGLHNDDRSRLMDLAIEAGGWYAWSDADSSEKFMVMDQWLKHYKIWKEEHLVQSDF